MTSRQGMQVPGIVLQSIFAKVVLGPICSVREFLRHECVAVMLPCTRIVLEPAENETCKNLFFHGIYLRNFPDLGSILKLKGGFHRVDTHLPARKIRKSTLQIKYRTYPMIWWAESAGNCVRVMITYNVIFFFKL